MHPLSPGTRTPPTSNDRAGFGWSPRSEKERTPQNIATELHSMLDALEKQGVQIQVTPRADGRRTQATTTSVRLLLLSREGTGREEVRGRREEGGRK